ncbi:MAG TPA: hypothetical protein PLK12_10805, partial [Prolixibacteraceae bacterium]|nr:hypothetical protein [Prolixibacteraceae bacterium]
FPAIRGAYFFEGDAVAGCFVVRSLPRVPFHFTPGYRHLTRPGSFCHLRIMPKNFCRDHTSTRNQDIIIE